MLRAIARESERGKNKRVGDGGAEMNPSIKRGVLYIQYGSELLGVLAKKQCSSCHRSSTCLLGSWNSNARTWRRLMTQESMWRRMLMVEVLKEVELELVEELLVLVEVKVELVEELLVLVEVELELVEVLLVLEEIGRG